MRLIKLAAAILIIVDDGIPNSSAIYNFRKRSRVSHDSWTKRSGVCEGARCATQELFNGPAVLQYDIAR